MKKNSFSYSISGFQLTFLMVGFAILFSGCSANKYSAKVEGEAVSLKVKEDADLIKYATMQPQSTPELASASKNRGMVDIVGKVASAAVDGVISLVDKEKDKYSASYQHSLGQCYFYNQISESSAFDPTGMQFTGFAFVRRFTDNTGKSDTAVYARFRVDEDNAYEIINNSVFKLKLDELKVNYAKAKIMAKKWYQPLSWFMAPEYPTLNMDFEISITSSFVSREGGLYTDVQIGKFILTLRDIPLDKTDPAYDKFYANVKNCKVIGRSFLVPRSFGYYYDSKRQIKPSYGQGMYNIVVKVNETSRPNFVQTMLFDNSTEIINQAGASIPQAGKTSKTSSAGKSGKTKAK
jgi:hypothetical protein